MAEMRRSKKQDKVEVRCRLCGVDIHDTSELAMAAHLATHPLDTVMSDPVARRIGRSAFGAGMELAKLLLRR